MARPRRGASLRHRVVSECGRRIAWSDGNDERAGSGSARRGPRGVYCASSATGEVEATGQPPALGGKLPPRAVTLSVEPERQRVREVIVPVCQRAVGVESVPRRDGRVPGTAAAICVPRGSVTSVRTIRPSSYVGWIGDATDVLANRTAADAGPTLSCTIAIQLSLEISDRPPCGDLIAFTWRS